MKVRELAPGANILVRQTDEYLPEEALENGSINLVLGFDVCMETPSRIHQKMLSDEVIKLT